MAAPAGRHRCETTSTAESYGGGDDECEPGACPDDRPFTTARRTAVAPDVRLIELGHITAVLEGSREPLSPARLTGAFQDQRQCIDMGLDRHGVAPASVGEPCVKRRSGVVGI